MIYIETRVALNPTTGRYERLPDVDHSITTDGVNLIIDGKQLPLVMDYKFAFKALKRSIRTQYTPAEFIHRVFELPFSDTYAIRIIEHVIKHGKPA